MRKFITKIQKIEDKLVNAVGTRFAYLLIFFSIIGCYFLGYTLGKMIF